MGRRPLNRLRILPVATGSWLLTGAILGRRIRERYRDFGALSMRKAELEAQVVTAHQVTSLARPVITKLSDLEMTASETTREWAAEYGANYCEVLAWARASFPRGKNASARECLDAWVKSLKERHRRERTLEKNKHRVEAFIRGNEDMPMRMVSPEMIERHVLRAGIVPLTQISDGQVLKTWLDWCVDRRYLAVSPFRVDLEDLKGRARPAAKPRILSIEEVGKLLAATRAEMGGKMLPYLALSLWCFMRSAEAQRTSGEHIHAEADKPFVEVFPVKSGTVSYRTVAIPATVAPLLRGVTKVYYSKRVWNAIRDKAGVLTIWQENLLRHTGMSYHYAQHQDIQRLTREAGNTSEVAFKHYLSLARPEDGAKFYALS